jgi:uncharacterized protein
MPAFVGVADWYYDWMKHPAYDPWWDWAELTNKYQRVTAAVLNLSGWHDEAYGPAGATTNFAGLVQARGGNSASARTHLVVGPWNHGIGPMARTTIGERDMGAAAAINYDELALRWMDHWVRGMDNGVDREPPVRVYSMGAGAWRTGERWPLPTEPLALYLNQPASSGSVGLLSPAAPTSSSASSSLSSDPANPIRDPFAERAGPHDYRSLNERRDVLTFETAPLAEDVEAVGPIEAQLISRATSRTPISGSSCWMSVPMGRRST